MLKRELAVIASYEKFVEQVIMSKSVQMLFMEYQKVMMQMKTKHIELLDSLKQEYGCQNRSRALELLLDDLLNPDSGDPAE